MSFSFYRRAVSYHYSLFSCWNKQKKNFLALAKYVSDPEEKGFSCHEEPNRIE